MVDQSSNGTENNRSTHWKLSRRLSCISCRLTLTLLIFLGFCIIFGVRAASSLLSSTNIMESDMNMSGAFFGGHLIAQIPGGLLAMKYPGNNLFGGAILLSSLISLVFPHILNFSTDMALCIKFSQGLLEGTMIPACFAMWKYWLPTTERATLITLAFSGPTFGVVIGILLVQIRNLLPLVYIITWYGCMGLIWFVVWTWFTSEKPEKHADINQKELSLINDSITRENGGKIDYTYSRIPWRPMFTSMPVAAIFIASFCRSYSLYFILIYQTKFLSEIYDIQEDITLNILPHLIMIFGIPCAGILSDYICRITTISVATIRKLFTSCGLTFQGLCFILVAFSGSSTIAITFLTIGVASGAFTVAGYFVNSLEVAPRYSSVLIGFSNTIGNIAGLLCAITMLYIPGSSNTVDKAAQWQIVFAVIAVVHFCGAIFYAMFASGSIQPWAVKNVGEENRSVS